MQTLTYNRQLELIKAKGIIIKDEKRALDIISNFNYYLFLGYIYKSKDELLKQNIDFEEIYTIYLFDKKFRNILAQAIEIIEISLKTKLGYITINKIGDFGYLDRQNFKCNKEFKYMLSKLEYLKEKNIRLIQKHKYKDGEYIPFYVAINIFTMGMIYNFYINISENDNPNNLGKEKIKSIRKQLASEYNTGEKQLESWIENIVYIRNMVAHYMRLYNVKMQKTPVKCNKNHRENYIVSHRIFDIIHIMKFLILNKEEWENIVDNIKVLFHNYKEDIDISLLGFPDNWETILRL